MVAAGDQRRTRWRAQCGGVKLIVPNAGSGDSVQSWRGNRATKSGGRTEADVIGHDQQNIRCVFGGCHLCRKIEFRLAGAQSDMTRKGLLLNRKHRAIKLIVFALGVQFARCDEYQRRAAKLPLEPVN